MQTHFSSLIMDMLSTPFPINGDPEMLTIYKNLIDNGITQLGNKEHTGDWDPFLGIILTDGTKLETETGYENFTITRTHAAFQLPNPKNTEKPLTKRFPISSIQTMILYR